MDIPRVVPCMPGATLDETVDDSHWKATMQVKLGPIGLTFATDVSRDEVDEPGKMVKLAAQAREVKNRGRANATIQSSLVLQDGGRTRIDIVTDLALSGTVAQYGRGMIQDISSQMVTSFAECLRAQLGASEEAAQEAVTAQAEPVSGLELFFGSIRRKLAQVFGRRPA
jgi:carbon monoxide dehydrogenase subunit G